MRTTLLAVAFFITQPALATHPFQSTGISPTSAGVRLDQLQISGSTATGRCGGAEVSIGGIKNDLGDPRQSNISSEGRITIGSNGGNLTISGDGQAGIYLQDQNKLHCVETANGHSLVLTMICLAKSCPPVDYRVIDPATAKVIGKPNVLDECDSVCAESALGRELPRELIE